MDEIDPLDKDRQELIREYTSSIESLKSQGVTDILNKGLSDVNGKITPLGELHFALADQGLITENGQVTDLGNVYNTTYNESIDADPQLYIEREKRGLNQLDKDTQEEGGGFISSIGDALTELGKTVWSVSPARVVAKSGLDLVGKEIDLIQSGVRSLFDIEQSKKPTDITPSFMEAPRTGAELLNAQASMVQGGLDTLFMAGGAMQYLPARAVAEIQGKEDLQLAVKQKQERDKRTFEEVNGAELLDSMLGIDKLMQNRDNLVKTIGEEEVSKQERGNRTAGGFVYDPINIASAGVGVLSNAGLKTALWAERTALTGRGLALEASSLAGSRANLEAKIAKASALVDHTTERANALAGIGDNAGSMRYNAHASRAAELVTNLSSDIEGIAARQATIDADIASISSKQAVADKIISTTEKWNAAKQMPANAVSAVAGNIGEKLIETDEFVSSVMDQVGASAVYDAFKAMPTKISSFASTSVLGPIAAVPGIVTSVLGAGPVMKSIGNFARVMGEQVVKERGSSSFWRRVANAGVDKPQRMFAKFMDEATLGGSATNAVKIVAKGTAHAYPMNLTFELLQDPNLDVGKAAGRALTPSLIFGGGGAGAAQIFKGSAGRLKDVRAADHINMIRSLTDSQKSVFYKMPESGQQLVSSYSAAYPNLNWEFAEGGASHYDPASNSIRVNINTNNPIRALIGHEILHYTTIRNNLTPAVNQLLFGFDGEGGLLRSADGKLEANFQKFHDEYNARLKDAGLDPVGLDKIGEEYFNESTVDHMLEMYDKGKLESFTGRTEGRRIIDNVVRTFVEKRPILRDLFFKTGGVYDSVGKMVQGNGILAEGIKSHPEARKLMEQMIRESAGDTRVAMGGPAKKFEKGKLIVEEGSPMVDSFHAILEYDSNGNPVKVDGIHKTISKQLDEARSMSGLILTEAQSKKIAGGYMPNEGELRKSTDGSWQGKYIHQSLLDELAVKGSLNSKQISILRDISRATKKGDGTRFIVVNHPATIKGRGGKVRYASLEATLRDVVPTAFSVTKQGNILVHLMSVDQLNANIEKRAASKTGDRLYGSNTELIKQDVSAMMDLHSENKVTDGHYQDKYGANWKQHKDFINTVFGLMTKEQRSYNPMFDADKIGDGGVFRTYRADRISRAVKDHAAPMPMGYDHIKVNMLPEGIPSAIEAGHTEKLKEKSRNSLEKDQRQSAKITDLMNHGYDLMHARGDADIGNSRDVIQFADWPKPNQRNEHYGKNHYVIKSSDLIPVPDWAIEWLSKTPEIIEYAKENGTNPLDEASKSMNPKDIVDSAGFWDDRQSVSDFYQDNEGVISNQGIVGFKTNDGAVIFDPYSANEKGIFKKAENASESESVNRLPELIPSNDKFFSISDAGREALNNNIQNVKSGSILGTVRFLPESENTRIMKNFPVDDSVKKKMEGKVGFAFASDWSDSNRPYITRNGRKIDILMGGVGYSYHPDIVGKGAWAGSFSNLTNRVLKKINQTDGIGLVVAGGRESTISSRSFSLAFMEELRDDLRNKLISRPVLDNIIKNSSERILGRKDIKSFSDYEKLLHIENNSGGLTFDDRFNMIKAIGSQENKKSFGLLNWNDVLKKYEMQNGEFQPGQIMSIVQFKKDAPLARASDIKAKEHKSYEAVIQGHALGMLTEKVMIGDFFKDFFESEGTQPASYTRKVQTKMPSFKYGEGSAVFSKSSAESISKIANMK